MGSRSASSTTVRSLGAVVVAASLLVLELPAQQAPPGTPPGAPPAEEAVRPPANNATTMRPLSPNEIWYTVEDPHPQHGVSLWDARKGTVIFGVDEPVQDNQVAGGLAGDIDPAYPVTASTPIPATDRRGCLMQDPLYRNDVTHRSMGYPHVPMPSYYLGMPVTAAPSSRARR